MKPNKEKLRDAISGLWQNALWLEDACTKLQVLLDPKGPTMRSYTDELERLEEKKQHVPDLRIITGGKEPPSTGKTWLDELAPGTCFVAKEMGNTRQWLLHKFIVLGRSEKTTHLASPASSQQLPVDPITFCNIHRLHENLGIVISEEELNDESNRLQGYSPDKDEPVE